ncbi:hypothetical protein [Ideonella oryzae]|uniref:Uncharacterized protein n=1 Tax=Ideonella oryzae TaxID=2937441 RepID=A0ABT1BPG8_9BURK|nr:hypothetical protein [Ideonella oryzae]MCO5978115.1 hypothetical protein [Ideonella oryzae]
MKTIHAGMVEAIANGVQPARRGRGIPTSCATKQQEILGGIPAMTRIKARPSMSFAKEASPPMSREKADRTKITPGYIRTCAMRVMLMATNFLRCTVSIFLASLVFPLNCSATIHVQENQFFLKSGRINITAYTPALVKVMNGAEVISVDSLVQIADSVLVILRRPSGKLALSRCGAGNEDWLALVAYSTHKLRLVDIIPLQSCEKDVTLVLPDLSIPDNPAAAIKIDSIGVEFRTLNPEMNGADVHKFSLSRSGFEKVPASLGINK